MKQVTMYTDGACSGNPGPGGWGVILTSAGVKKELFGGAAETTNNRMEMMAVIAGAEVLKQHCAIAIYTDSNYVLKGMTEWVAGWKKRDWRTASRQPVKNVDLWQRLEKALERHEVSWNWVKGHSGDAGNDRADELARMGIPESKR